MQTRPTHPLSRMVAAATLLASGIAMAQISLEPPPGGGGAFLPPTPATVPAPATAPATATTPAVGGESAQSVLQGLLREKAGTENTATNPATNPAFASVPGSPLGPDGLLREGEQLELRGGHLLKQDNGSLVFVFDPKETPAYPPMAVVPCRRLAAMEDAAGFTDSRKGADMTFRISAEVTQYRGKNYLYIQPSGVPLPAPVIAPAAAPATMPATAASAPTQVTPATPAVTHNPEGALIINRTGRLVRDTKTGAELFVLDSDGKLMADPPMGVVPCKLLAVMEDATDHGNKPAKFRISGEVTLYRGRNYLYLKVMSAVVDLHQGVTPGVSGG